MTCPSPRPQPASPSHINRGGSLWLVSVAMLLHALIAGIAAAHDQNFGFVYASQPTTRNYSLDSGSSYTFNDAGGGVLIVRSNVGSYEVLFGSLAVDIFPTDGEFGTVQVTAYGSTGTYCKLAKEWIANRVYVQCYDAAGIAADSRFSLLYHLSDEHPNQNVAYAYARMETSANYIPPYWSRRTYNPSEDDPVTFSRSGTGVYEIEWANFGSTGSGGGHVQVTAVGPDNARCQVQGWMSSSATIRCFSSAGIPVDSKYSIFYSRPDPEDPGIAFAWAEFKEAASYTPSLSYSHNPAGGGITASRSGSGRYRLEWGGLGALGTTGGNVQVTAYGSSDTRCATVGWGNDHARVECRDSAGDLIDSQYSVLYLDPVKKHWTSELAMAFINHRSSTEPLINRALNPTGGDVTVTMTQPGHYSVRFEGLAAAYSVGGNVQVTSWFGYGDRCIVESWSTVDDEVKVQCFQNDGSPTETASFHLLFLKGSSATPAAAYAWANIPTAASYTPSPLFSNNPAGGAILAERLSQGHYRLSFQGFGASGATGGGNVQITPYGTDNQARCIQSAMSSNYEEVEIICLDEAGAFVDSRYTLLLLRPEENDDAISFLTTDSADAQGPQGTFNSFNSGDGEVSVNHLGTGVYTVTADGFGERGSVAGFHLVTVRSSTNADCDLGGLSPDANSVRCTRSISPGGGEDARFSLLSLRPTAVPEPSVPAALACGSAAFAWLARRRERRWVATE